MPRGHPGSYRAMWRGVYPQTGGLVKGVGRNILPFLGDNLHCDRIALKGAHHNWYKSIAAKAVVTRE